MSYGQRAVGITFNPAGDPAVNEVKTLSAQLIDICNDLLVKEPTYSAENDEEMRVYSERGQLLKEAIRQAQAAQMWIVKAITYKN